MVFEEQRQQCVMHNILTLLGDSENVPPKDAITAVQKAATGRREAENRRAKLTVRARRLLCLIWFFSERIAGKLKEEMYP